MVGLREANGLVCNTPYLSLPVADSKEYAKQVAVPESQGVKLV